MFSACGSTNPYGGRTNIKRKLFAKRKTHSSQSDGGIDLKKVKGKHCVETWASLYDQNISTNNHDCQDNQERPKNRANLSEAVKSESLVKLEKCVEAQLLLSVELNKEKECKPEEPEDVSR